MRALADTAMSRDAKMMHVRIVAGVLLLFLGVVWIAQGLDVLQGSSMTGQGEWAVAGVGAAIAGLGLIGWDVVDRRRQ